MAQTYRIIWPEYRVVSPRTIQGWYSDAKANNELNPEDRSFRKSEDQALALHRAGLITLGN